MSTAGVAQLVFWGVVVVFIAAMFFRGWRKQVRSLRTETPEEAKRRVLANRRADGEHHAVEQIRLRSYLHHECD
jgi:hypothetical protein